MAVAALSSSLSSLSWVLVVTVVVEVDEPTVYWVK